jgi:hypothetical protein
MTTRGSARPEATDQECQWHHSKRRPCEHTETVHVGEQMRLVAELTIDVRERGRVCIASRDPALHKKGGQCAHTLLQQTRCLRQCRAHDRLMVVKASLACSGDEGDPEAATPIAEKIGSL